MGQSYSRYSSSETGRVLQRAYSVVHALLKDCEGYSVHPYLHVHPCSKTIYLGFVQQTVGEVGMINIIHCDNVIITSS